MKSEGISSVITSAFNKWADKLWFQILAIIVVIYLLAAPVVGPVISSCTNRQDISETLTETLNTRDANIKDAHKQSFVESREAYALAKHEMLEYLNKTGAEYIFLIEYHNGSENVMTGIQFCRFDITIEVSENTAAYIPLEKFKDDIVVRYDILLSEDLSNGRLVCYNQNEFEKIDKYLAYQLHTIDAQTFAALNLEDKDDMVFGTIVCIATDGEKMNLLAIHELARILEDIFNKNIYRS